MATSIPFGTASVKVPLAFTYPANTTPIKPTGGEVTSSDPTIATVVTDDTSVTMTMLGKPGDFTVSYAVNGLTASADFTAEAAPAAEPTAVSLDVNDMVVTPAAAEANAEASTTDASASITGGGTAPAGA